MKKIWIWFSLIILGLTLFITALAYGEGSAALIVSAVRKMKSYAENELSIQAPESGNLTITVQDENHCYNRLHEKIPEGSSSILWNGLGFNDERLNSKTYHFLCELRSDSGKIYEYEFDHFMDYSVQALMMALPSSGEVALDADEQWFLESKTVLSGTLVVELSGSGQLYSYHAATAAGKIHRFSFRTLAGKKKPTPGDYHLKAYEASNPRYAYEYELRVVEHLEAYPLTVTGEIMPDRNDDDDEIWRLMQMPAVVVDIGYLEHEKVYASPDTSAEILGTLHGQTQSLSVLELNSEWAKISAWNHEEGAPITGWVISSRLKTVIPQTDYGLLLDKKKQTLTVFYHGKRLDTLLVSSGRMEKNELYQETAAGSFLTGYHKSDFSTNGLKYDYVIQYDGGNMLHQIPYAWGNNKKDFTPGRSYLGTKASHACIRVQASPGHGGLNAYWIWTHIPYQTRLIILDDPEERQKGKDLVSGNIPQYEDTPVVSSFLEETDDNECRITLTFGGDAALGGRENYYGLQEGFPAYIARFGKEYPFSALKQIFTNDNITSINLECVLKSNRTGENLTKTWRFRGLPEYAEILDASSVEIVNIANNHTIDYGLEGMESTIQALTGKTEICGNGINSILELKGVRIGFGGCRETTYLEDPDQISRDIQAMKSAGCDLIVYQCHWGNEYVPMHNKLQEAMARTCIREGANLVVGHHPHVVQGLDIIEGVPVIYSLGNLCFGGTIQMKTFDGLLTQITFCLDNCRNLKETVIHLIPILTSASSADGVNDYQPVLADGNNKNRIMNQIQADTAFRLQEYISVTGE